MDDDGTLIAFTIEDAAAAMADLNWLVPGGGGVLWSGMPGAERRGARAAELRRGLDSSGKHPGVHGR